MHGLGLRRRHAPDFPSHCRPGRSEEKEQAESTDKSSDNHGRTVTGDGDEPENDNYKNNTQEDNECQQEDRYDRSKAKEGYPQPVTMNGTTLLRTLRTYQNVCLSRSRPNEVKTVDGDGNQKEVGMLFQLREFSNGASLHARKKRGGCTQRGLLGLMTIMALAVLLGIASTKLFYKRTNERVRTERTLFDSANAPEASSNEQRRHESMANSETGYSMEWNGLLTTVYEWWPIQRRMQTSTNYSVAWSDQPYAQHRRSNASSHSTRSGVMISTGKTGARWREIPPRHNGISLSLLVTLLMVTTNWLWDFPQPTRCGRKANRTARFNEIGDDKNNPEKMAVVHYEDHDEYNADKEFGDDQDKEMPATVIAEPEPASGSVTPPIERIWALRKYDNASDLGHPVAEPLAEEIEVVQGEAALDRVIDYSKGEPKISSIEGDGGGTHNGISLPLLVTLLW